MYHLIFVVKIKNNMTVCILGEGLSSLTLAKALVNEKIYVDVLTSKKTQAINQSRTLGISKSNIEFFNKKIINIENIIWKIKKIHIFSDNLKNEKLINFENNNQQLFSIIKNYKLYDILKKDLKKNRYFKKKKFKKNLNDLEQYDIVINTDYSNYITKKYFSKKIVKKYNSYAYTAIIDHKKILNNIAIQIFTKKGPFAFLPISNNKTSIVFSIVDIKKRKDENVKKLINYYNNKYKIQKINKIESFELQSLNLRSYYQNKFLAFGDLLHRIHPLAGQGFNMTLRDIKIFLKIVKHRNSLGLPLDYSVNKEFEKKIKHRNLIFSKGIDLIYEFFNIEKKIKSNVLSKSVKVLGKNQIINRIFTNLADRGILS